MNAGIADMPRTWAERNCAAFVLDAKTDLGTTNNRFGGNSVGEGPRAILHLRTNLGSITVRPM